MLLGEAMRLDDDGWRKLSMRWCLFFLTMAVVNEIVRRNFSESFWVWFKVGGFPLLTFAFLMTQIGFIQRHQVAADTAPNKSDQR
jgi:intracellular septation protein